MATTADIQLGDAQLYTDNLHLCIQAGGEQLSFYHGVNREAKVKTLMNTIKLRIEGLRKKVLLMNGQFVAGALANITFRFQDVIQYTNAAQHLFLAGYNFIPL